MAYTDIDDPSAYFQALVYAGTGGLNLPVTHTNTGNSDLQPDFIWFKDMGATYQHYLVDSSRGRAKGLHSDDTSAETTTGAAGNDLVSFDTDGFKVGAPSEGNSTNGGTTNKVAWQWKSNGGTTASNSNGSITSTVQANTTAGFSIVTYTGTGSAATVGHGLGVVPSVMIIKNREYAASWVVYHKDIHADAEEYGLRLNNTNARESNSGFWNNTAPTSSVFTIGGNAGVNNGDNTDTLVAYCFAEKQGYSKFGSYVGNGNANGPFIYTGFKPAFLLVKAATTAGQNWLVQDNKRPGSNPTSGRLFANTTGAENTDTELPDHLSNGFKVRSTSYGTNKSGETYIYMAFAENPFVTSTGIPTTAR